MTTVRSDFEELKHGVEPLANLFSFHQPGEQYVRTFEEASPLPDADEIRRNLRTGGRKLNTRGTCEPHRSNVEAEAPGIGLVVCEYMHSWRLLLIRKF